MSMDAPNQKYEQTLMIPPEIRDDINAMSGFINPTSCYSNKTIYGLFMTRANIQYVTKIIEYETGYGTLDLGCSVGQAMKNYRRIKTGEIEYESIIDNPVIELAYRNREFVRETLQMIKVRNAPLNAEHRHQQNLMEYQNIDDFHFKEVDWGTRYAHLGDKQRNVYRWGNRIPPDRISAQQRHYERDNSEGLRDHRELETVIHGYDMSSLMNNSSNRMFENNEYTSY